VKIRRLILLLVAAVLILSFLRPACVRKQLEAEKPPSPADKPHTRAQPFTVVMLPDTQLYARKHPELFRKQLDWVRDNVKKQNFVFVTHIGDVVQSGGRKPEQWKVANEAMSVLDGVVPWGVCIGNHDYDSYSKGEAKTFIEHFGPKRFAKYGWFGGHSGDRLSTYQLFTGGGVRFLILHLQCDATDATIKWARGVLDKHPALPTIVSTHIYLPSRGKKLSRWPLSRRRGIKSGRAIWDELIKVNPQIFLVLCGHYPGENRRLTNNDAGLGVMEVVADYQMRPRGGGALLRLIRFDPPNNRIGFRTYSPVLGKYDKGPRSEFSYPYDLLARRLKLARKVPARPAAARGK